MKKHNLFKIVMITILVAVLLSWVLPVVSYNTQYGLIDDGTKDQVGMFSLMSYVGVAIQYFSYIGIYVLCAGGLYGVLHFIPAYKNLIDKVVKSFKNKEWLFILLAMLFVAGVSAFANMYLAIIVLFPFLIAVILAMGYDRITAALVTCGSVVSGLIGSAFSVNNTYGIDSVLETTPNGGLKFKAVLFVVAVAIMIVYTILYAKKHKTEKDVHNEIFVPKVKANSSRKGGYWPIIVIVDILLLILILGFISWEDSFKVTAFTTLHEKVSEFAIFGFPLFGKILGLTNPLGAWSLVEGTVVVVLAAWAISFIYRVKFGDFISCFMHGCEKALKASLLVVLVYVVLVVVTYVPYVLGIVKPLIGLTSNLNVFTMSLSAIISSFFGVESYYAATGTGVLPYVLTVYTELGQGDLRLLAAIWQAMYGLTMLVAPTSVVLMATLSYLNVPYHKWLKGVWKVALILLVALLALFLIKTMI